MRVNRRLRDLRRWLTIYPLYGDVNEFAAGANTRMQLSGAGGV